MTSVLNTSSKAMKVGIPLKAESKNNDPVAPATPTTKKSNGKRKSASLPSETVEYLKAWMMSPEHIAHPYPTEQEKVEIMKDTGIELKQLTNWFVNNRKRYWKPRVEARLQQQAQAAQAVVQAHAAAVAAVSAVNLTPHQQQMVATSSQDSRANLVSPTVVGFKYGSQSTLSTQGNYPPLPSLQKKSFSSSPLTFAAQLVEERKQGIPSVPLTSAALNGIPHSSSSAASVSASEGEISDSGNASDDASSDGTPILGTDLKFIDLKMKKKFLKSRTPSISSTSSASEIPQETSSRSHYARNVSFCSLDKISMEVVSANHSQDYQVTSTKRSSPEETSPYSSSHIHERKRFRTNSVNVWRQKCRDATHMNDDALPSLEEASRLFGFTSA